jgi:response regulator RpfG family c-di-GMP phosphodiesterase
VLRSRADIDLIVADIMMPEMSGLELLRVIKDSVSLRDVPVIFCTASMDVAKVRLAAALGCCYYLLKPVQRDLLLQKVSTALSKGKALLLPKGVIQAKLGIDEAAYMDLVRDFIALLDKESQVLDFHQKHPGLPAPPSQFKLVAESAATLGAEQLEKSVRTLLASENRGDFRLECMRALRDMQRLLELLKAQFPTNPSIVSRPASAAEFTAPPTRLTQAPPPAS